MAEGRKLVRLEGLQAVYQNVDGKIGDVKSAFTNGTEQITGCKPFVFTSGYYRVHNNLTVVDISAPERSNETSKTMVTTLIACQPGEKYTIRAYGAASAAAAYGYLDADCKGIYRSTASALIEDTLTVPNTVTVSGNQYVPAWLIVNNNLTNNGSDYYAYKGTGIEAKLSDMQNTHRISDNSIKGMVGALSNRTVYTPDTFGYFYNANDGTYADMAARLTQTSSGYSCMLIEVNPGEIYHIHTNGGNGINRGWVICQADATRSRYMLNVNQTEDTVLTIQQGERYLAINNRTETGTECWAIKQNDGLFDWAGKNVAIIGDSICTNGDYIVNGAVNPFGNVPEIVITQEDVDAGVALSAYVTGNDVGTELHGSVTIDGTTTTGYTITSEDSGKEITFVPVQADVTDPPTIIGKPLTYNSESRKVWWEHAADVLGFNPIPVCWSGSSVSSHEGGTSYAWHESTIRKCGIRTPGSMTRTAPDLIIVSRGANDFTHAPYAKVEEDYLFNTMHGYPETDEYIEDGSTKYSFPRACALLVKRLRTAYPNAQIVFCTFNYLQRIVESYPSRTGNTGSTYLMWNECVRNVANAFGCHLIEFDKDGLTYENISAYTRDNVHPNDEGHKIMGNRAIIDLKKINSMV